MYMWVSDREGAGGKLGGGDIVLCVTYIIHQLVQLYCY